MNRNLSVTLTGFNYIEDGCVPEEFEVCLVVCKDGSLSAACWDTGYYSTEGGRPGCFRQSRGGVFYLEDVIAWLPIEEQYVRL